MEDVLCIVSCQAFVILEMEMIVESDDRDGECLVRPLPLKRIIRLDEAKLPIAMGYLKLKNDVYMFGGEFPTGISSMGCGIPFGARKPGFDVLKLDLCDPHSKLAYVGKLRAPKIFPFVFEFNSKIYILSPRPHVSFEVWDPVTAESFLLPSPPLRFNSVTGYFLTEKGIVMNVGSPKALFFNIRDEKWEILSELCKCPPMMNLQDWGRLHGVQAAGENDFVLAVRGEKISLVNILKPWETQAWDLVERYWDLMGGHPVDADMSYIVQTSEQTPRYNCLITPCINYKKKTMTIIIDLFRVQRNASSPKLDSQKRSMRRREEVELFSLISLTKHVYEFNYHKSWDRIQHNYPHYAYIWSLPEVSRTSEENMEWPYD